METTGEVALAKDRLSSSGTVGKRRAPPGWKTPPQPGDKRYGRSRITNGNGELLPDIDGRSIIARRYKDIASAIFTDQSGADQCSEARTQLIRRFAAAAVLAEQMESKLANGEQINIQEHALLCSTLTRLAQRIGIDRVAREVPSLSEYLRSLPKHEFRDRGAGRRGYCAMKPDITLSHALADPALFGGTFGAPSFWTWRVVAKLIDGLPLTEQREIDLFEECTGRDYNRFNRRAVKRLIILAGRRAGKDRFESAVAVWRAALCTDWRKHQSAGEGAVCLLLGADKKQAAILRRYCHGLLQTPLLAREVTRSTGETTEFRNGASLEIATNDPRLVRGRSAIAVLGSECCYWKTDEYNAASDAEVVPAAVNSMAMCPDTGLLMLASSVYRKVGYMYAQYKKLFGNDEADELCWFAPSIVMNPRLPASVIDSALADDKSKASAEFNNIWREDIADFLPLDVIEACTDWGVHERPPQQGVHYFSYHDAAGGTGRDSFTLAILHCDGDRFVFDAIRERQPRFVAQDVIKEYSDLLRTYGISSTMGDTFGAGMYSDEWERNRIAFRKGRFDTSDTYRHALPFFMAKRPLLLDHAKQRLQLAGLERRVTGGHEKIEHPQTASAHDDIAAAVCGALVAASNRALQEPPIVAPFVFSAGPRNLPGQYSPRIY